MSTRLVSICFLGGLTAAGGCGDDDGGPATGPDASALADGGAPPESDAGGDPGTPPGEHYLFESRFISGQSSVVYTGQTTRQVVIKDLTNEMEQISADVLAGTVPDLTTVDEVAEVRAITDSFVRNGTADLSTRALPSLVEDEDSPCQSTYADLGEVDLLSKIAGEDDTTDHRDWDGDDAGSAGPEFAGWTDSAVLTLPAGGGVDTPVRLLDAYLHTYATQVSACVLDAANCPTDPDGGEVPLYVTPEGLDLVQLVDKFLRGSILFSQGTDDYLDSDVDEKGLSNDNTVARMADAVDTALEHAWDEGFGYFGAAVNYTAYTDDELRADSGRPEYANGYHDFDGDGCIDLFTEYNFNAAVNAAKRDAGSTTGTDLSAEVFGALLAGRTLIAEAGGDLDATQQTELEGHRDTVVEGWEKVIAATAIHYVNETIADMGKCGMTGPDGYSFTDHAKHWSELKGFALAFQFNPRSPFVTGSADFVALHTAIGDQPVLCTGDTATYETALLNARDAMRDAYGFEATDASNW